MFNLKIEELKYIVSWNELLKNKHDLRFVIQFENLTIRIMNTNVWELGTTQ